MKHDRQFKVVFFSSDALSTAEVADILCLHKLTTRKWFIQGATATTGEGVYEGMREMADLVKDFKKSGYGY